jgi:tetratricopeptide (TPR) repeat protein
VAYESRERYYLVYAWDALVYLAALRGDEEALEARAARCDELDWESGQRAAAAEILYYRSLSYRALGRLTEACEWLTRAIDFAEQHGFNRTLFAAEKARASLESPEQIPAAEPAAGTSEELRSGLREMKDVAVGAGV